MKYTGILYGGRSSEPDYVLDLAAIKTRAIKKEDGYVINGEKTSITYDMQGDAIVALAFEKYHVGGILLCLRG